MFPVVSTEPRTSTRKRTRNSRRASPRKKSIRRLESLELIEQAYHARGHVAAPAEAKLVVGAGEVVHQHGQFGSGDHARELRRSEPGWFLDAAFPQDRQHALIEERGVGSLAFPTLDLAHALKRAPPAGRTWPEQHQEDHECDPQ